MAVDYAEPTTETKPAAAEQLHCALTGKPISAEEAYWAPPLVTFRELLTALSHGLRAPALIGPLLFSEQPNVPYAPEARDLLATRRSAEQSKLLFALLFVIALIATPIVILALR